MTKDLTEQWKKGELDAGWYYITTSFTDEALREYFDGDEFRTVFTCNVKEVLAPVPSYEQWNAMLESNDSLVQTINALKNRLVEVAEENAKLKETIKRTKANGNYPSRVSAYKSRIATLCEENQKLKERIEKLEELLKEVLRHELSLKEVTALTIKISEVLK